MPITELKDVIPILDVRNVDTALRFYIEQLGFQVDFRYEEDPNNYAGVRRGGVCLHMQRRSPFSPTTAAGEKSTARSGGDT